MTTTPHNLIGKHALHACTAVITGEAQAKLEIGLNGLQALMFILDDKRLELSPLLRSHFHGAAAVLVDNLRLLAAGLGADAYRLDETAAEEVLELAAIGSQT